MERKNKNHDQNLTTRYEAQQGAGWQQNHTCHQKPKGMHETLQGKGEISPQSLMNSAATASEEETPLFPNHSRITLHHKFQKQPKSPLVPAFRQGR